MAASPHILVTPIHVVEAIAKAEISIAPATLYRVEVGDFTGEYTKLLTAHLKDQYGYAGVLYISARCDAEFIQKLYTYIEAHKVFDVHAYLQTVCSPDVPHPWTTSTQLTFADVWGYYAKGHMDVEFYRTRFVFI